MLKVIRTEYNIRWEPNMTDALLDPYEDGSFTAHANVKGRKCIDSFLPERTLVWGDTKLELPEDWRTCEIKVGQITSTTGANLPLDLIPPEFTLAKLTSGQAALLLALGVQRDGGRAAVIDYSSSKLQIEVFMPRLRN